MSSHCKLCARKGKCPLNKNGSFLLFDEFGTPVKHGDAVPAHFPENVLVDVFVPKLRWVQGLQFKLGSVLVQNELWSTSESRFD